MFLRERERRRQCGTHMEGRRSATVTARWRCASNAARAHYVCHNFGNTASRRYLQSGRQVQRLTYGHRGTREARFDFPRGRESGWSGWSKPAAGSAKARSTKAAREHSLSGRAFHDPTYSCCYVPRVLEQGPHLRADRADGILTSIVCGPGGGDSEHICCEGAVIRFVLDKISQGNAERRSAEIMLPAVKRVIASRLNMTAEHLSRVFRELIEAKLIEVDGPRVFARSVARLKSHKRSHPGS